MSTSIKFLINRLHDEGAKSINFFNTISPDEWEITVYSDGSQWTLRQVLAHFALAEADLCRLVEQIVEGGQGVSDDFDLNAYNEYKVSTLPITSEAELIEVFRANRQNTIDMVSKLTDVDLEKTGKHPFLGITTIQDIIKLIYRHNQIHIREIRQIISQ